MWSKIKEVLKALYVKISCYMCCKSNCNVEVGRKKEEDI